MLKLWKTLIYWHSAIFNFFSFKVSWPLGTLNSTHPWFISFPLLSPFPSVISFWILRWSSQMPSPSSNYHSSSSLDTVHKLPRPVFLFVLILLYSPVNISGAYRQYYELNTEQYLQKIPEPVFLVFNIMIVWKTYSVATDLIKLTYSVTFFKSSFSKSIIRWTYRYIYIYACLYVFMTISHICS